MTEVRAHRVILAVDDDAANLAILDRSLSSEYTLKLATNGLLALQLAEKFKPDLILLDVTMPGLDGYEVCRRLKNDERTRPIPVIFVTAHDEESEETQGLELGAVDYLTKPINPAIVRARVRTHLALYDQNRELDTLVRERTHELEDTRLQIIRCLGHAAEYRDNETGLHVLRMSAYSQCIAKAYGVGTTYAELVLSAAPMHDIGKIGIPDHILLKPGKLDEEEWNIMRRHPGIGALIIGEQRSELLQLAKTAALTHHEKWDGTGYPNTLAGDAIPLIGRIVAVADVFDALTTKRPYKEAWPLPRALALISEERGRHFEPAMVDAFDAGLEDILRIKERYREG